MRISSLNHFIKRNAIDSIEISLSFGNLIKLIRFQCGFVLQMSKLIILLSLLNLFYESADALDANKEKYKAILNSQFKDMLTEETMGNLSLYEIDKNSLNRAQFFSLSEEDTLLLTDLDTILKTMKTILKLVGFTVTLNQLNDLKSNTAFIIFLVGTGIFLIFSSMACFLDYSIRARTCKIYEGCSSSSYICEYVIKLRYGLISCDFDFLSNNLVIEFLSDKRTLLSRFFVSGAYFEDGLNVGNYLERDMRLTTLILYKRSLLTNLYYVRLYIEGPDSNIGIHVYNIDVGSSDSTLKFDLNSSVNEKNDKLFKLNQIDNLKCSSYYNGPMIETSYLQSFLFIYFFFCTTFAINQLFQTRKFINLTDYLIINVDMLTNSVIVATITALLYTVFRDLIHLNYCLSCGNYAWLLLEYIYEMFIFLGSLYCVAYGLLHLPQQAHKQTYFVNLVLITTLSLFIWIPLAFILYLKYSPRYFHLGRIVLQSQVSKYYPKNFNKIANRMIRGRKYKRKKDHHKDHHKKESLVKSSSSKDKFSKNLVAANFPPITLYPYPGTIPVPIPQYQNYYPPNLVPAQVSLKQNLPYNFEYQKMDVQKSNKLQPYSALLQTQVATPNLPLSSTSTPALKKATELTPIQTEKAQLKILKPGKDNVKRTPSNSSLVSTGSDYYAQIFREGKVPKVGSISQYGSLLKNAK